MAKSSDNFWTGYIAADMGYGPDSVDPNHPEYDYWKQGYDAYQAENANSGGGSEEPGGFSFEMPEFNIPEPKPEDYIQNPDALFSDLQQYLPYDNIDPSLLTPYEGKDYIWQGGAPEEGGGWQEYSPAGYGYGWTGEGWEQAQGGNYYDLGYSQIYTPDGSRYERATYDDIASARADAASSAVDLVNQQIADESQNAQLLGISYDINDEVKQQRINDAFATMWGEGSEQQYVELSNTWGVGPNTSITRGDGSTYSSAEGGTNIEGSTAGMKPGAKLPTSLMTQDDEGPFKSILGGI
jgi:hypothetical protein